MKESLIPFEEKVKFIKEKFFSFSSPDESYKFLIEMGKNLPTFPKEWKSEEKIVPGCQSLLYLKASLIDGKVYFNVYSEALISAGLAWLLVFVYNGESPETILKSPPRFVEEIGLYASLSPSRSNGLNHIYLRMKQEALKLLLSVQ